MIIGGGWAIGQPFQGGELHDAQRLQPSKCILFFDAILKALDCACDFLMFTRVVLRLRLFKRFFKWLDLCLTRVGQPYVADVFFFWFIKNLLRIFLFIFITDILLGSRLAWDGQIKNKVRHKSSVLDDSLASAIFARFSSAFLCISSMAAASRAASSSDSLAMLLYAPQLLTMLSNCFLC